MKVLPKSILISFFLFVCFVQELPSEQKQGFVNIVNGSMYYEEFGHGAPIILVHGGPGLDQGYLKPQLLELDSSHRLIFYDQRGSGNSLKTPLDEKHINLEQFVDDLESLRKSLGIEKFILMGHSWGGLLGMQYAITHPDRLIGLMLLNSAPADYKGQKAFAEEFAVRTKNIHNNIKPLFSYEDFQKLSSCQITDLYEKLFSVYFYNPEHVKNLSLDFSVESAQSGFKVMEEMPKTSWLQPHINLFPKLKVLNVPTFILHGKEDIIPLWTVQEIRAAIPNSEIIVLDKCGHFPYIEQPVSFFNEINKFLDKIK